MKVILIYCDRCTRRACYILNNSSYKLLKKFILQIWPRNTFEQKLLFKCFYKIILQKPLDAQILSIYENVFTSKQYKELQLRNSDISTYPNIITYLLRHRESEKESEIYEY